MADIATLGIAIDTRQVASARGELVKLETTSRSVETATTRMSRRVEADFARMDRVNRSAALSVQNVAAAYTRLAGVVAGLGIVGLAAQVVRVSREMEVLRATLRTVTGSAEGATRAFTDLQKFAATTPYDIQQVTEAFIRLRSLGLDASIAALTSYGNTASAMGRSMSQFIEAVADATTGEFERLKEFGIRASRDGDRVVFTFRGQSTIIRQNAQAIQEYLLRIGRTDFAGAMAERAATLDGALSNLGDASVSLMDRIGRAGLSAAVADLAREMASLSDESSPLAEGLGKSLGGAVNLLTEGLRGLAQAMRDVNEASSKGIWSFLSENSRANPGLIDQMFPGLLPGGPVPAESRTRFDLEAPAALPTSVGGAPLAPIWTGGRVPVPGSSPMKSLAEDPYAAQTKAAIEQVERMALEMREAAIRSMDQIRDVANGVLSGFLSDLREGASLWDALGNAANRVIDAILNRLSSDAVDALLGRRGTTETGLFGFGAPRMAMGAAANSNVAGAAPIVPVTASPLGPVGGAGVYTGPGSFAPAAPAGLYGPPLAPADPSRFDGAFSQFVESPYNIPGEPPAFLNASRPYGIQLKPASQSRFDGAFGQFGPAGSMAPPPVFPGAPDFSNAAAQAAQAAQNATTSFANLGGTLQATTPQVGGLGEAIAGLLSGGAPAPGGGLGSVFASIFAGGAAPLPLAGGGPVYGRGSSTSDSIPARLSNGEYVVNAAAAARNRGALDAINSGRAANENRTQVNVYNSSGERAEVRERQTDLGRVIDVYVGKSMASGKYDKAIGSRYGMTPKATRRGA